MKDFGTTSRRKWKCKEIKENAEQDAKDNEAMASAKKKLREYLDYVSTSLKLYGTVVLDQAKI